MNVMAQSPACLCLGMYGGRLSWMPSGSSREPCLSPVPGMGRLSRSCRGAEKAHVNVARPACSTHFTTFGLKYTLHEHSTHRKNLLGVYGNTMRTQIGRRFGTERC